MLRTMSESSAPRRCSFVLEAPVLPASKLFPDCGTPEPTRIVLDLEEIGDAFGSCRLMVTIRSGRGHVLASGITEWVGAELVDMPRALEAAWQAFLFCEETDAAVEAIKLHHHHARKEAKRHMAR